MFGRNTFFYQSTGSRDVLKGGESMNDLISRKAGRVKIGDRVYVHGHVDEIRKDIVIIRNDGGISGRFRVRL